MTSGKFLIAATAVCLAGAPVLAQHDAGGNRLAAANVDPHDINAAQIGEIKARDIDAYQRQMRAALAITDPPRRDAAVTSARRQLAQTMQKPLTAGTIAELDGMLDIGGVSPQLGAAG